MMIYITKRAWFIIHQNTLLNDRIDAMGRERTSLTMSLFYVYGESPLTNAGRDGRWDSQAKRVTKANGRTLTSTRNATQGRVIDQYLKGLWRADKKERREERSYLWKFVPYPFARLKRYHTVCVHKLIRPPIPSTDLYLPEHDGPLWKR